MGLTVVVTTAERLGIIRDSLDRLTNTFQVQADAGVGFPHDLLLDAIDAIEAIRDFAGDTSDTAINVTEKLGRGVEPQSLHYRHGLRLVDK